MTQPYPQRCCHYDVCYVVQTSGKCAYERFGDCASYSTNPHTPAAPATEPKCDDCRFVKECSLLYFPPCEQLARNDERHYREKAKAEREQVLPIFISKAYTRIETVAPMEGIHKGWVLLADVKECLDSLRDGAP